jgi:hypothetical protein
VDQRERHGRGYVNKRRAAYAVLFVIGLGLLPLGISGNTAFLGLAVVFFLAGAAGLAVKDL